MPRYTSGALDAHHLPPGTYECRIEEAKEAVSKAGNDMIKIRVRLFKPDGTPGPLVWEHLVFVDSAAWKIDQVRASLGFKVVEGEDVEVNPDDLLDRDGVVTVDEEDVDGRLYNRITDWVLPDEMRGAQPAQPAPGPTPSRRTAAKPGDDAIPF